MFLYKEIYGENLEDGHSYRKGRGIYKKCGGFSL